MSHDSTERLPRLGRLLGDDGRCVVGLFDNGLFGEPAWSGLAPLLAKLVSDPANAVFDALSLPPGSARILQRLPASGRPALIVRGDVSDFWLGGWFGGPGSPPAPGASSSVILTDGVETAIRLDATAVISTLIRTPSDPGLQAACLRSVDAVRARCSRHGMPLLVETAAFAVQDGALRPDLSVEVQAAMAWQAFELGADLIKTDPTEDPTDFGAVVAAAGGVPVLAGSGAPTTEAGVIERSGRLVDVGAAGVAYGGNFTRATDPFAAARKVVETVHARPPRAASGEG